MEYVVITSSGTFDFTLGKLAVTNSSIAAVDENGAMHAKQGEELLAVMRADFAQEYQSKLAALEELQNRSGRYEH
jgi:hypothetical protein